MVQYKPGSSQYKRVRPFLLLLTCGVSFSFLGCPQHPKIRTASFPCGHQDVQLSDQTGVDKKNVFVCDGDTLTSLSTRTIRRRLRCPRLLGRVSNTKLHSIMTRTGPSTHKSSSWVGIRSASQISQRRDDAGGVFRVLE